jgi:LysR family nitrogen assimilation transcriptional regulator
MSIQICFSGKPERTLNLRRIEAFLTVAEAGSVSRAAAQLEVAQSVVSRHVKALEDELGFRLFERTGRGVAMTPTAQRLAPRLRQALDEMHRATIEAGELGDQPYGVVRIGVVPAGVRPMVGLLFRRVSERFPRVRLHFVEGFGPALEERLARGELDLAVINRYGRLQPRGEERLCVVGSLVVGPAGAFAKGQSEMPFKSLADVPLVLASRPNGLRLALDQMCRRTGVQLCIVAEADSQLTMKELVAQGLFTVLPHAVVHEELSDGSMSAVKLVKPSLPRTLSLATSTHHPGTAATRAVGREIRDIVAGLLARSVWR